MSRFWRYNDELEATLRATRAEPPAEFLDRLAGRLEGGSRVSVRRIAVAGALTAGVLVAAGTVGGIGYASSAARSFVNATDLKGVGNAAKSLSASAATPASDQYVGKTTICHRTHSPKNPFVVITVSNNALPAHKRHGDTLTGPGATCPGPPIP